MTSRFFTIPTEFRNALFEGDGDSGEFTLLENGQGISIGLSKCQRLFFCSF
jgi:hypothetical protein